MPLLLDYVDDLMPPTGLASVWSDPVVGDPHLVHSHVVFRWEELEPCRDIFKNDPDGKLQAEIVIKPYPPDSYLTPTTVLDAFGYECKNRSGAEQTILVDKSNTGNWKGDQDSEAIEISDYKFDNSLGGGNLQLMSNGDGEDIFHMLKVEVGGISSDPHSLFLPLVLSLP